MGVRHVVMFRFKADATDEQLAAMRTGLTELPTVVDGVAGYVHGPDLGVNEGSYDYAIVADFADMDDYLHYRDHPWHRRLIEERIRPVTAERAAIQYDTGD